LEKELLGHTYNFQKDAAQNERKWNVYREALKRIEAPDRDVYTNLSSDEVRAKYNSMSLQLISNPSDLAPYHNFIKQLGDLIFQWMTEKNRMLDELGELRLVASEQVLTLLDEYSNAIKVYLQASLAVNFLMMLSKPGQFDSAALQEYQKAHETVHHLRISLIGQMRKDLGF
jgi:hypothetical protein